MSEDISETAPISQPAAARRAAPLRKNRRRPDYLLLARQIALLFVAAELLHAAFASPRLAIRGVKVAGSQRVPAARITALAAVPNGRNIFHVNLQRVRERVLQEPMLRDATVTRRLPDTIAIAVTERVPMLVIRSGGRAWEVDELGVAFRERPDAADSGGLPALDLAPGDVPAVGARLPGERFHAALTCLRLAEKEHLPLRKISFDERQELWLNIAIPSPEGERLLPVRLGRCEDLEAKVGQLPLVLPAATADGEYLDLMCATRAAYRKHGAATSTPPAAAGAAAAAAPAPGSARGEASPAAATPPAEDDANDRDSGDDNDSSPPATPGRGQGHSTVEPVKDGSGGAPHGAAQQD